ncbi:MAG: winged helix-turn-helix transcriptional regulator [Methanobacteriota archaeon]|nr:MAG: winged helix-turn-helix transcriptional regulator [Euryarchaeota archaeon]
MSSKSGTKKPPNGVRPRIANYIQMHPGTSFKTIKTIFGLADGTLRYHLGYLEKKGKIRSDPDRRVYYPTRHREERSLSKTQQRLIHTIRRHPGITQKELSVRAKMSRVAVRKNLTPLVEKEMLSIVRAGRETHHFYVDPEDLERTKALRLVTKFLLDVIDEETYWDLRHGLVG